MKTKLLKMIKALKANSDLGAYKSACVDISKIINSFPPPIYIVKEDFNFPEEFTIHHTIKNGITPLPYITATEARQRIKESSQRHNNIMTKWLPIETAPKDGRKVLITNKNNDIHVVQHEPIGEKQFQEEWSSDWYDGYDYTYFFSPPTHWQPLPPQPREKKQ